MTVFGDYAEYYNLLYADKNYQAEADFVLDALSAQATPRTVLDLGCGSGAHAFCLAEKGLHVVGIDRSEDMLNMALNERAKRPAAIFERVEFLHGDITNIRLDRRFDAVTALFHVMSYLPDNKDFTDALQTVSAHLKPSGIFIFDFWYGPAVLHQRPLPRTKHIASDKLDIWRFASPQLHINENQVLVSYDIIVHNNISNISKHIHEKHLMRYYFKPELEMLLSMNGFSIIKFCEYLTGNIACEETWNVVITATKTSR